MGARTSQTSTLPLSYTGSQQHQQCIPLTNLAVAFVIAELKGLA